MCGGTVLPARADLSGGHRVLGWRGCQQKLRINTALVLGQRDEVTAALFGWEHMQVAEVGLASCPAAEDDMLTGIRFY